MSGEINNVEYEKALDRQIQATLSDCNSLLADMQERIGKLPALDVADLYIQLRKVEEEIGEVRRAVGLRQQMREAAKPGRERG